MGGNNRPNLKRDPVGQGFRTAHVLRKAGSRAALLNICRGSLTSGSGYKCHVIAVFV